MTEAAEPEPEPTTGRVIDEVLLSLWGAVNALSRLKDPTDEYRVTIFGSARLGPDDPVYGDVRELARRLAARGCSIVTGGGPGLMQAANEGEQLGDPDRKRRTVGIRVNLPFEAGANPYVEESHFHETFFSRLHHFVHLSHAFIVVPGGIGTTLEALMVWQLLQVRHLDDVPLVFVGPMWRELVAWAKRTMLATTPPLASAADLDLPVVVDDVAAAAGVIEQHLLRRELTRSPGRRQPK